MRVSVQLMNLVKTLVKSDEIHQSDDETYESFETIYKPEVAHKAVLGETHENFLMVRNSIAETSYYTPSSANVIQANSNFLTFQEYLYQSLLKHK